MNVRDRHSVVGLFLVASGVIASAQQHPRNLLSERIHERSDPTAPLTEIHGNGEISFDMESLVKGADLIVYGQVENVRTTLQVDGKNLITEYTIIPTRRLWPATEPKQRVPGVVQSLIIRKWGGQATIEGVAVSQIESSVPAFHVGDELLICLERNAKTGEYSIVADRPVFVGEADHIRPATSHIEFQRYRDMPISQFESRVQELRSATR
jgi:hypothetical protein